MTKIVVNSKGQLLDHEGVALNLVVPMTSEDRRKLIKDIREEMRPVIMHSSEI